MSAQEKEVTLDNDATMKVRDVPVNLPEKVTIVDAKIGKEIGFIEREKVMETLEKDRRFTGFEDSSTGQFMLAYSNEPVRDATIVHDTESFVEFLSTIRKELETVIAADDVKKLRLGVSWTDQRGNTHVMYCHIKHFKDVVPFLSEGLREAMSGSNPTDRLIKFLGSEAQLNGRGADV